MHRVWLAAVFACACYSPAAVAPCAVRCTDSADCPGDLTCDPAFGLCTDGAASCVDGGSMVACEVDGFADDSAWTPQTGPGTLRAEFGTLRFEFNASAMGFLRARRNTLVDLTDKAVLLEVVQAPGNGHTTMQLDFRVVHAADTYTIRIANELISGFTTTASEPAVVYTQDPNRFRHLKIEHTTTGSPRVSLAGSPDRGPTWTVIASFPAPPTLADSAIEIEMSPLTGTMLNFAMAAEVDNFEIDDHECIRGNVAPLVRDQFEGVSAVLLEDHMADLGGDWVALHGAANVGAGVVEGQTDPTMYRTGASELDYDVEADVFPLGNVGPALFSVIGRAGAGQIGIGLEFNSGTFIVHAVEIAKVTGNPTFIGTCLPPPPISTTERHRLRVRLRDGSLHGYIDGVEICTVGAIDNTAGFPALHFGGDQGVFRADNFIVTAPK